MELELWLDESGDFTQDAINTKLNPSLVGGVLLRAGELDEAGAEEILGSDFVHFNQEAGSFNLEVLERTKSSDASFVIFENLERVMIIDGDTTYLNVLAEGITRLLLHLSAEHQDFHLHILIATRKNISRGHGILTAPEYEHRLRERVIVALARKTLSKKNHWEYKITFDDARTSRRLMLADAVCNTYLTRTSSKFNHAQRQQIRELYTEPLKFSFFENTEERELQKRIAEGNYGEALFHLYSSPELPHRPHYLSTLLSRLSALDDHSRRTQFENVSRKIETLMIIDREYEFIKAVLQQMQKELFPLMEEHQLLQPEFQLDMILTLYAVYTHEGSVLAEEQDDLVLAGLPHVEDIMIKLKYFHLYKVRRGMYEKNMLRVAASIEDLSAGIQVLTEMLEMIDLVEAERDLSKAKYQHLGRAYGSRGQGYTMLIAEDSAYLSLALEDFDQALAHFTFEKDRERQYLYKSLACIEAGEFPEAAVFLFQSCQLQYEGGNFGDFLEVLKSKEVRQGIFKYHAYFKMMAAAKQRGKDELADTMFASLHQAHITVENLQKHYGFSHPLPFIFWFQGSYTALRGKRKAAAGYLDQGIAICEALSFHHLTLKVLQLGMMAEKALLLQKNNQREAVVHLYKEICRQPAGTSFKSYLHMLEGKAAETVTEDDLRSLIRVTQCIN